MNLEELDNLLADLARKGETELYTYYQGERAKLVKQIMGKVSEALQ